MNDETVLISPSKMCQNHTHTQGGGWYKTNEVNVRRQVTNSQMPMYCARVRPNGKWKDPSLCFVLFLVVVFVVVGVSVLRCRRLSVKKTSQTYRYSRGWCCCR